MERKCGCVCVCVCVCVFGCVWVCVGKEEGVIKNIEIGRPINCVNCVIL